MVSISLPDGKIKKYESPVTGNQIAKDIAPSLLKKALVVEVNGKYKDLVVLNISKNHEYWEKKIDYDGRIRSFSYQFINLDKQEYELLKPYEKKILRKGDKLIDTYIEFFNTIYTGLFNTDKRKKYPIDQFRSFLGFEEQSN